MICKCFFFDLSILLFSLTHRLGCICLWFPAFSRFLQKYCSQSEWGSACGDFDWAFWIIQGENSRLDKLIFDFVKYCVLFWSPQPCTLGTEQLSWLSEFRNMWQKFSQLAHHLRHLLTSETECGGVHSANCSSFVWVHSNTVVINDMAQKLRRRLVKLAFWGLWVTLAAWIYSRTSFNLWKAHYSI